MVDIAVPSRVLVVAAVLDGGWCFCAETCRLLSLLLVVGSTSWCVVRCDGDVVRSGDSDCGNNNKKKKKKKNSVEKKKGRKEKTQYTRIIDDDDTRAGRKHVPTTPGV